MNQTHENNNDRIGQLINSMSFVERLETSFKLYVAHSCEDAQRMLDKQNSSAMNLEYVKISGVVGAILGLFYGILFASKMGLVVGLQIFGGALLGGDSLGRAWNLVFEVCYSTPR